MNLRSYWQVLKNCLWEEQPDALISVLNATTINRTNVFPKQTKNLGSRSDVRDREEFIVNFARIKRYQESAIPYCQRLLNQHVWDKQATDQDQVWGGTRPGATIGAGAGRRAGAGLGAGGPEVAEGLEGRQEGNFSGFLIIICFFFTIVQGWSNPNIHNIMIKCTHKLLLSQNIVHFT